MESLLWLIPALPLAGFAVNGALYLWATRQHAAKTADPGYGSHPHADHAHHDAHAHDGEHDHAHAHGTLGPYVGLPAPVVAAIALVGPVASFVLSVMAFLQVHEGTGPLATYFSWIATGDVSVGFGLQVDALTAVMLLNITGIGSLIHLYSYGYMHEDAGFPRFMAYLNLFLASMIILVMGDSLPLLFVGWEGVGLCSYLLIGFWWHDFANVDAGRKAFVVNRIGDLGFLLGMFALYGIAGGLDWATLEHAFAHAELSTVLNEGPFAGWTLRSALLFATGALFVGATGKSAQIPLYVWLPDAMAGPTPVSALIHAATMVTAGIYLLGRLDFLYGALPEMGAVVAIVAASTALLSGAIAVAQNDIKKVLAYSTVSQLGFMFAGMATGVFWGGLFHVLTHAFFKALLFLGAGAVIHAMHGEQDIRKMGGLWKDLRVVAVLFLVGSLALAGVPPFSGFFSKDTILGAVHFHMSHGGGPLWTLSWWMLVVTAALTAFYTTRLVVLTFFGAPADAHRHLHPVHWTMTSVLAVLAVLAAFGGALAGPLERFTHPVWAHVAGLDHDALHHSHEVAMAFSVGAVVLGLGAALFLYGLKRDLVRSLADGPAKGLRTVLENKLYVDEAYAALVVGPTAKLADLLFRGVDRALIDGTVDGSGKAVLGAGGVLSKTQPGAISAATLGMAGGAVLLLGYLLWQVANG